MIEERHGSHNQKVHGRKGAGEFADEMSEKHGVEMVMSETSAGHVVINKIVVPKSERGSGVGSSVMRETTAWADEGDVTLSLTPSSDFGGSKPRLVAFYRRFGFVENSGRNRDYSISETMYRPKISERNERSSNPPNRSQLVMTDDARHAPIEFRSAAIGEVKFAERMVEVIAVPYEQEAIIEYRGEAWRESFLRGAFDGIETRAGRVRVNREHDESKTFGKVVTFHPSRQEGLVAEVQVAKTPLGDEVLELVSNDMLGASGAYGVRNSDQILNRPYRQIKRAFLRHLSFVEVPAYEGAGVLSVRGQDSIVNASELPPIDTPKIDEVLAWLKSRTVRGLD